MGNGFAGAASDPSDTSGYELYLGVGMPPVSGPGVFLNPQRIFNAANLAPAGNPIAPGEYVALFGSNLAAKTQTASPPYPMTLQEVSVLIDGAAAPLYYVSPGMISVLVPYRTAGTTATIVVNNNGAMSNAVEVPVAATAPGVFSQAANGIGPGIIQHTNLTPVNAASRAKRGETVLVYLSGPGAVSPPVTDGTSASAHSASAVIAPVSVLIGGLPAMVSAASLAPGVPGLYVVGVVVPPDLNVTAAGPFPLAVETPDSFHDMVDLIVSP